MKRLFFKSVLISLLSFTHLAVQAEDIDLFAGVASETDLPNVLFIIDNTANWNTAFTTEMQALAEVFASLPVAADGSARIRAGVMFANETGSPNNNISGGYVRAAMRPMTATNKALYAEMIKRLDINNDKGNGGISSLVMAEAYRYFTADAPHGGNGKVKADYSGNSASAHNTSDASKAAMKAIYDLGDNALSSLNADRYQSPLGSGCPDNFIIFISNGPSNDNNSVRDLSNTMLKKAGGDATQIALSPSGSAVNPSDEWARFMKSSIGVTTYTVDVITNITGQTGGWSALLSSMAQQSDGKYYQVSDAATIGEEIRKAIDEIMSEIQSVESVFSAVSLPVSVNTQGTFLNQVYIGMFKPDGSSLPRWDGNLKQYKLGFDGGVLKLLDANNASAINANTGFITACARSFWTSADDYWTFDPIKNCLIEGTDISNSPDGNIVEKGAQAQKLRSTTDRSVLTCSSSSCTGLAGFNNTTVTQAMLGADSPAERDMLINWAKGLDLAKPDPNPLELDGDENRNGVVLTEMRVSAHGDVVHSRPVAINYGSDESPNVVVFYGGNDGMLRAVNGNRNGGEELWSFVAPEFHNKIKRLRENKVTISFPSNQASDPAPQPKDYGVDGPVAAYLDNSTAWIYSSMRRGGRTMYAFDVSSKTNPSLKWRLGCPNVQNDTGCTSGFADIGQTWATPKLIKAAGSASPLLLMGGGYDTCHDNDTGTACNTPSKGKKIYLLNALADSANAALLQTFDTENSVIADITVIPDSDGNIKYAYTADLGGNVYRISGATANTPVGTTSPGNWTITKIAALGGTGADNRKFMFAPDVVDDNGTYVLLLGSGDREKPLLQYSAAGAVNNYFYAIQDQPQTSGWPDQTSTCGANLICMQSLYGITTNATPTTTELSGYKGWYLGLKPTERVVTSAITVFGTVTFSTFLPSVPVAGSCEANLGTAMVYNINYKNAASLNGINVRGEVIVGGGLPPSPVAGMVKLDDGSTVPFIIGSKPTSSLEGGIPPVPALRERPKSRAYWNIVK